MTRDFFLIMIGAAIGFMSLDIYTHNWWSVGIDIFFATVFWLGARPKFYE
jgi:hypothetical protein